MAITPARGSPIGAVSVGTTDDFFTDDLQKRLTRLSTAGLRTTPQSQVIDKDGNVLGTVADFTPPPTSLDQVMSVNPRQSALKPFSDMYQGIGGFIPKDFGIPRFTGDADTVGGQLLQGLGNVGIDALEGLRIAGGLPVAAAATLGTESEPAYQRRMENLARIFSEQTRMQGGQLGTGFDTDEPTGIVGGPSYQQTPTDPDQDAAIRSQIADAQAITEEQGIFGDTRQPGMGVPDFVGGVPSAREEIAQAIAASDRPKGDPRTGERERALAQGMPQADETTPLKQTDGSDVKGADNPVKQSTVAAINDVLRQVRSKSKPKDYDDYMKEFANLTGLDISGQPDNSQALMAFGLALMQNKAGKGFNVGRMLSEVGAAGEKAMPALAAARKEAKQTRIKAAEFAISRKKEDEAAAFNRTHYYAVPKGEGGASAILQNLDKAQTVRVNGRELNDLLSREDFADNYELIPASTYLDVVKEAAKPTDLGDPYLSKLIKTPLFEGATDFFSVNVQVADGNYKGQRRPNLVAEDASALEARFESAEKELNLQEKEFAELTRLVQGNVTVGDALLSSATSFGKRFGVGVGQGTTSLQKAQYILKKMAVKNTKDILGEAGKTISDADRALVKEIVGDIDSIMGADEDELLNRISQVYELVVTKGRRNLDAGYASLHEKGINIGPYDPSRHSGTPLNEDEQAELERLRKAQGVST